MESRLPPQALDMEEAVLGALLQFNDAIPEVNDFLKPRMFYKENHQIIYSAITDLNDMGIPVDSITVSDKLKKTGKLDFIGGPVALGRLTSKISSDASTEYESRIIQQQFILRELIKLGAGVIKKAYDPASDCFEILEDLDKRQAHISGVLDSRQERDTASLIDELNKEDAEYHTRKEGTIGLQAGLKDLDEKTGGFRKTDLIIIAGRPSMGKSALITNIILYNARKGIPSALFTLEVNALQATQRFLAQMSGVEVDHIMKKRFDNGEKEKYEAAKKEFAKLPIYIDDTPAIGNREFRSKCIRMKRKYDLQFVVGDYIGLFNGDGETREQKVGSIADSSKALAKELNIPIIQLSQLSRAPEKRNASNPRPILSDLRDSGNLEQSSDMVIFIYRPEYYKKKENVLGESLEGVAELNIAKFKNGETCKVNTTFVSKTASFEDLREPVDDVNYEGRDDSPF